MPAVALPFDSVVRTFNGLPSTLSVNEFLALPLHDRVRLVLESSTVFLRAGAPVERRLALSGLRAWSSRSA